MRSQICKRLVSGGDQNQCGHFKREAFLLIFIGRMHMLAIVVLTAGYDRKGLPCKLRYLSDIVN